MTDATHEQFSWPALLELQAQAADNICRAFIRYHEARLNNAEPEHCLDLENHAESLAGVWDRSIAQHAGPWLACCEEGLGRKFKRLETESGQDMLMYLADDSKYLVERTI